MSKMERIAILYRNDIIPNIFGTFLNNVEAVLGYDAAFYLYAILQNSKTFEVN
jgi:hypothetical protein